MCHKIAFVINEQVSVVGRARLCEVILDLTHVKVEGESTDKTSVLDNWYTDGNEETLPARNLIVICLGEHGFGR